MFGTHNIQCNYSPRFLLEGGTHSRPIPGTTLTVRYRHHILHAGTVTTGSYALVGVVATLLRASSVVLHDNAPWRSCQIKYRDLYVPRYNRKI